MHGDSTDVVLFSSQIWFGKSNFSLHGTDLEERMRSHPLLVEMGTGVHPSPGAPAKARMLSLGGGYQRLAEAEGGKLAKAADWRYPPEAPPVKTHIDLTLSSDETFQRSS